VVDVRGPGVHEDVNAAARGVHTGAGQEGVLAEDVTAVARVHVDLRGHPPKATDAEDAAQAALGVVRGGGGAAGVNGEPPLELLVGRVGLLAAPGELRDGPADALSELAAVVPERGGHVLGKGVVVLVAVVGLRLGEQVTGVGLAVLRRRRG